MKQTELKVEYVDSMPSTKEEGVLYISKTHGLAIHLCACGCGEQVVTPLNGNWPYWPNKTGGWDFTVHEDGTVTLSPSIGNFQFPCRSHYFIRRNKIVWV